MRMSELITNVQGTSKLKISMWWWTGLLQFFLKLAVTIIRMNLPYFRNYIHLGNVSMKMNTPMLNVS